MASLRSQRFPAGACANPRSFVRTTIVRAHAFTHAERYDPAIHVLSVVELSSAPRVAGRDGAELDRRRHERTATAERLVEEHVPMASRPPSPSSPEALPGSSRSTPQRSGLDRFSRAVITRCRQVEPSVPDDHSDQ